MIALFAAVNLPAISVWAVSGAALQRLLNTPRTFAVFNVVMALLLVGSMAWVLFGSTA